jgi:hypothetical protein
MMYEETFGTDWTALDADEAMRRAYALGVAASLGRPTPEEFERIVDVAGSSYDRSLVELAYSRGRNRGRRERTDADSVEQVWSSLVEGGEAPELDDVSKSGPGPAADPPPALSDLGPADDRTEAVELPRLLERDDS